jgi:hypothetical protein
MPWMMEVLTSERKNFHGTEGHADAEDDAGDGLLGLTLAVGEHQPADNYGDQRQRVRNGAGEGGFEDGHGVVPRVTGTLGIHGECRKEEQGRCEPPPPVPEHGRWAWTFHVNVYFHELLSFACR